MVNSVLASMLGIIGSVSLFVFSIILFGRTIRETTGEKIKTLTQALTANPIKGTVVGVIIAAVLQSSSAASVLLAGLADAGFISFFNTLGVIFGINIGTTLTAQLIAFDVMFISPFIVLAGLILHFWGNGFKKYGTPIVYFGLLFFSIYLISFFASKIDGNLVALFLSFTTHPVLAIFAGIIATIVFQSSSVVSGIVLILAGNGAIDLTQSVGLILGANIGTTSTVLLASLAMGREAKKVALAHFFFNVIGVLIIFPFRDVFYTVVSWFDGGLVRQVANIYLLFNVTTACIFLLGIKPFFAWISALMEEKKPTNA